MNTPTKKKQPTVHVCGYCEQQFNRKRDCWSHMDTCLKQPTKEPASNPHVHPQIQTILSAHGAPETQTPITDARAETAGAYPDNALVVPAAVARTLETTLAATRDALKQKDESIRGILRYLELPSKYPHVVLDTVTDKLAALLKETEGLG